jgi:hypothetical protein
VHRPVVIAVPVHLRPEGGREQSKQHQRRNPTIRSDGNPTEAGESGAGLGCFALAWRRRSSPRRR